MNTVVGAGARDHPSAPHVQQTESLHSVVELKVHGVSGTPPEKLLDYPPELIDLRYGDENAGFYRRRKISADRAPVHPPTHSPPDQAGNEPGWHTEAFSWGGLTSGPATRALWLLFVPFILVNLAHWMLPPTHVKCWASWSVRLLRLLGLTLTLTLSLALTSVVVDIVGWQCAGSAQCAQRLGPLAFLSSWTPGARLAVSAAPVLAVVAVLLIMQKQNPRIGEPPPDPAVVKPTRSPLTQSHFWNGDRSVDRLRNCHLTVWFSAPAALVLAASTTIADGSPQGPNIVLLIANLAFFVAGFALTGWDRVTARGGTGLTKDQTDRPSQWPRWMWLSSLFVSIASLAWVLGSHLYAAGNQADPLVARGPLPYLAIVTEALIGVQAVLLLALVLTTWMSKRSSGHYQAGYGPTLNGLTAPCVATLAWLIAGEMSVAVGFWVARFLGEPVQSAQAADTLNSKAVEDLRAAAGGVVALAGPGTHTGATEPSSKILGNFVAAANSPAPLQLFDAYFIGSAVNLVVIVAMLGVLVYVGVRTWRRGRAPSAKSKTWCDYGEDAESRADEAVRCTDTSARAKQRKILALMEIARVEAISSVRAWAKLTDRAPAILSVAIVVAVIAIATFAAITVIIALARPRQHDLDSWFGDHAIWTEPLAAGQAMTALFASVAIGLAYRAFRNRETRRRVAVLWDLATFWPRASHPLGPPCYGERAVPDLRLRVSLLSAQSKVVIAAHSQGSVIAAAAMLMNAVPDPDGNAPLTADDESLLSRSVALLTFGSPLRRLYARNFPAYFGFQTLELLRRKAQADATPPGRWVNLWALSDPIGGWTFDEDLGPPPVATPAEPRIDRRLADAKQLTPTPTEGRYPPICGHSGFWTRPEYGDAVTALESRIATPPSGTRARPPSNAALDIQAETAPTDTSPLIPCRLPGPYE